jgi:dihydroorotate dehydrogenase electron transfer subunit
MVMATRGQFIASVVSNSQICREHYRLMLGLEHFPPTHPGQFIQIACRDVADVAGDAEVVWPDDHPPALRGMDVDAPAAMLRRPFSLAGRRDIAHGVELEVIHRVVGIGTAWLSELRAGDAVSVLGPLGNRFTSPRADQQAILVGGGVGIPPMLYLATKLEQKATAFVGAVTRDLLPVTIDGDDVKEFAQHGVASVVSTDDGSFGFRGFVTQALEKYLDDAKPRAAVIYTCGPELMMKRVASIAAERGIECQVAVERAMACGMGTCQSCCIRVRKPDAAKPPLAGSDWCYRLACTDGPVFRGADLLW